MSTTVSLPPIHQQQQQPPQQLDLSSSNFSPSSMNQQQNQSYSSILSSPTASQQQQRNVTNNASHSPSSSSFSSSTYGDMFGATIHFWLESIVARCRCDRVSLYLPHPKHHTLVRVAVVGPTAQPISTQNSATSLFSQRSGDTPFAAGPVTSAVLHTGIAANLSQVAQEDALDCPGTTVAKNALIVPIKPLKQSSLGGGDSSSSSSSNHQNNNSSSGSPAAVGVIYAVNKLGGSQVFSTNDQYVLISVAPSIAYMAETYPVDFAAHRFDPSPLHRIISQFKNKNSNNNRSSSNPNTTKHRSQSNNKGTKNSSHSSPKHHSQNFNESSSSDEEQDELMMMNDEEYNSEEAQLKREKRRQRKRERKQTTQANLVLPEKPPQLIYNQAGSESMIPYVSLSLEEKSRANYDNAINNLKKKNSGNNNKSNETNNISSLTASPSDKNNTNNVSMSPPSQTTPEEERNRIFDQTKATLEELALHRQMMAENPNASPTTASAAASSSLSTAQQIISVGEFVDRMEQCWRDAVSRTIATERELALRNAQVVDAHSILHRKQRRLEILKDVLVESLEKKM